jgi:NAD+ kinase
MRVLLFANTMTGLSVQTLESVYELLKGRGIEYSFFSSAIFEKAAGFDELSASIGSFDLVCSFGGDGTTLRAAHLIGTSGVALLSYNFGRLGFLSGAGRADIIPALSAALDGKLERDERTMVCVEVTYQNGQTDSQIALNEVVVSRGHFGRIVALDLFINGTLIDTVKGDGVLVSTPTGSTAYSLSAGGPIISPEHKGLCVVPISPHSLKARAVITAADDVIRLEPNSLNRQQLVLFIDGEVFWMNSDGGASPAAADRGEVVSVEIAPCKEKLVLLRYGAYDFYDHISQTFFRGGND